MTDTQKEILRQVEFYFSDLNFPDDQFMQSIAEQNDGYVPIVTIASFQKMKQLSGDIEVIKTALLNSNELEMNEDKTQVRRKSKCPSKDEINEKSFYAKGFPLDIKIEDVITFYSNYGKVLAVRFNNFTKVQEKKFQKTGFKGSLYVEMSTKEESEKVLSEKPKYKESSLEYMTRVAHLAEKMTFKKQKKEPEQQYYVKIEIPERVDRVKEIKDAFKNFDADLFPCIQSIRFESHEEESRRTGVSIEDIVKKEELKKEKKHEKKEGEEKEEKQQEEVKDEKNTFKPIYIEVGNEEKAERFIKAFTEKEYMGRKTPCEKIKAEDVEKITKEPVLNNRKRFAGKKGKKGGKRMKK